MRLLHEEDNMAGDLEAVLEEGLFRYSITKERKRTERSGLGMVMLLIGLQDIRPEDAQVRFATMANALSAIKSDMDILGWFERQSIMGLIVPELDASSLRKISERLEADFQKEFTQQLEGDLSPRLSISLHVYPEPWRLEEAEQQHMDPAFFPELRMDGRLPDFKPSNGGWMSCSASCC